MTKDTARLAVQVAHATEIARELLREMNDIDAQLGDTRRRMEMMRTDEAAYWDWRHRAIHAKNARVDQYRVVREVIRQGSALMRDQLAITITIEPGMTGDDVAREAQRRYQEATMAVVS